MGTVGEGRELVWWQAVSLREKVASQAAERREVGCLRQESYVRISISSIVKVNGPPLGDPSSGERDFAVVVEWRTAIPRE
jgi:hypothetical protein